MRREPHVVGDSAFTASGSQASSGEDSPSAAYWTYVSRGSRRPDGDGNSRRGAATRTATQAHSETTPYASLQRSAKAIASWGAWPFTSLSK
jgi:hypothetical protein